MRHLPGGNAAQRDLRGGSSASETTGQAGQHRFDQAAHADAQRRRRDERQRTAIHGVRGGEVVQIAQHARRAMSGVSSGALPAAMRAARRDPSAPTRAGAPIVMPRTTPRLIGEQARDRRW